MIARLLFAATCFLVTGSGVAQTSAPDPATLYVVVFQATVNASGRAGQIELSRVIDTRPGATAPMASFIPDQYTAAARTMLLQRTYPTDSKQLLVYTFYDPAQPGRVDISPAASRP
ncbi:hypothetical protein FHW69_000521 [Luteibacter sp. Sphag1AF]|uniref:hypothetical protein n=1 Tax=Luteibacter sp. Sphag1AF TaxID=2587031 RepID=UPI00161F8726|nr:hypothetical protein [Luteibacter sp. Sphag1AF]MBB3225931.1 hypothetical protein [Luteibacter sp. Sphag1AF]